MIILEKTTNSVRDIYGEFSSVIGLHSPIAMSMFEFLTTDREIKSFTSYTNTFTVVHDSEDAVCNNDSGNEKLSFKSYDDIVEWALSVCQNNIPSPFKIGFPSSCHTLSLSTDYFTIRFPNNIGVGVKVFSNKKGNIQYSMNIVFYTAQGSSDIFIKETEEYKKCLEYGWYDKSNIKV